MKFRHSLALLIACMTCLVTACKGNEEIDDTATKLSASPTTVTFTKDGGSQTVHIDTDSHNWSIKELDSDWLTADPMTGDGPCDVTLNADPNTGNRRVISLVVTANGCKNAFVSVIQEAAPEPVVKKGLYAEPEIPDADGPCTLYYKADSAPFKGWTDDLYAHIGIVGTEWAFVQADWSVNIDKCKWIPTGETDLWKLEIKPTIREWFGSGDAEVSKIGVVVRSKDGATQTSDLFVQVNDTKNKFEPAEPVKEAMPSGCEHGINYNTDGSVTVVLYDKDKKGASYDWCYVIGEFSQWQRKNEYAMKRDDAAGCWWYTFTGIDPDKEYMFQYYLGKKDGSVAKVHDPYTEIVYDGYNDKYISSTTYPGLPAYPEGTSGLVSAFKVNKDSYTWQNTSFSVSDPDDIVIYEMHFRDFTSTGDINGAMEKLDYLQDLGVNAIELMPVQEFEGNDSWGYNPCSYFALDKAYGTRRMYKELVDACHSRGIAVIVDVVYNQATGAHPYAKLYWDATNNKTASNNPWFNVDAPHPYSVFHDWNHEFDLTRDHVKKSLRYLLEEYKVDGFRFDLTKGFTNKNSTEGTASNYDQSRIDILKDYNNAIREVKGNAIVILEHFCAQDEEKALAQAGMKVWRNMNNAYCQAAMGFSSDSDFSGLWTGSSMPFGSYVGFMESHDEERTAYKSKAYGNSAIKGSVAARMKREALNAAFFLTVPGPKMLWQFQELGYDVSIETGGRTGKKPLHWEYYDDADRKALYDTYAKLLKFRKDNPELFRSDASFSWKVGTSNWSTGRTITCTSGSKGLIVAGNFDLSTKTVTVNVPDGSWKNYFTGEVISGGGSKSFSLNSGEFIMLVK